MKPFTCRTTYWLLGAVALASCEPDNKVKPGAPQIVGFAALDSQGAPVSFTDPDGGALTVSPRLRFVANLDRLIDPTTVASVTDAGIEGKPGAITIESAGMPTAEISYDPSGDEKLGLVFPTGPRIFADPAPTLPSGSLVTVRINPGVLKAKDTVTPAVLAMGTSGVLTFTTDPLTATIAVPSPPVIEAGAPATDDAGAADVDGGVASSDGGVIPTDGGVVAADGGMLPPVPGPVGPFGSADGAYVAKVTFNNLPGDDVASHIHVSAWDSHGVPMAAPAILVAPTADDALSVDVQPAKDTTWPAGATIEITVDANAADPFGMKLGQPVSAAFTVEGA